MTYDINCTGANLLIEAESSVIQYGFVYGSYGFLLPGLTGVHHSGSVHDVHFTLVFLS